MNTRYSDSRVLVVGFGSIGRRHFRNLKTLGISHLAICDPDPLRLAPVIAEAPVRSFSSFEQALESFDPTIVVVCSPPAFHVDQTLNSIRSGADVFCEKPLAASLVGISELIAAAESAQRVVQVGYNLRFHPAVRGLKKIVSNAAIGRVLWGRAEAGSYLPNWRPWQDYRESYTARRDLGGGVIFDLSHELDYLTWLLGDPVHLQCFAGHISDLAVDVEDSATLILGFGSGLHAEVHIDCVQRVMTRCCKLVGELGSATWEASAGELRIRRPDSNDEIVDCACDDNATYIAELEHFFACVDHRSTPLSDLRQAARVVELCVEAHECAQQPRKIRRSQWVPRQAADSRRW